MPVIKTGYGWGLWGLEAGETSGQVIAPSTAPTAPVQAQFGFVDGIKVWTNPSQILPAFGNLGSMFSVAPWAAVGFLAPVVAVGFLLLGGAGGAGYVVGRRRARRAANPKRRHPGRRRNPRGVSRRIRGSELPPAAQRAVLSAYGYRWTVENEGRARDWFRRGGHKPPTAPLVTDAQWLADHSFAVTAKGELSMRDKWATPHYLSNPRKRRTKSYMEEWQTKATALARAYGESPGRYGGKGKPKRKRKSNPRRRNGRSYVVRGHSIPPGYVPGPGKVFYLGGRKGVVKSVYLDEDRTQWVQFRRPVDGTTGMSLGNFRQAAYIE